MRSGRGRRQTRAPNNKEHRYERGARQNISGIGTTVSQGKDRGTDPSVYSAQ